MSWLTRQVNLQCQSFVSKRRCKSNSEPLQIRRPVALEDAAAALPALALFQTVLTDAGTTASTALAPSPMLADARPSALLASAPFLIELTGCLPNRTPCTLSLSGHDHRFPKQLHPFPFPCSALRRALPHLPRAAHFGPTSRTQKRRPTASRSTPPQLKPVGGRVAFDG